VPLILIGIVVWPLIYNYQLFSLARLKNSIDIGDSYEEVISKFKQYEIDQ